MRFGMRFCITEIKDDVVSECRAGLVDATQGSPHTP